MLEYADRKCLDYPPFPDNLFAPREQAIFNEYQVLLQRAMNEGSELPVFPEKLITPRLNNTLHDTAEAIIGNWIGMMYQITNSDRKLPFMEGVDPDNPLGLDL